MRTYTTSNGDTIQARETGRFVHVRSARRSAETGEYDRVRPIVKSARGWLYYVDGEGVAHRAYSDWVRAHEAR